MKKYLLFIVAVLIFYHGMSVSAAPMYRIERSILPETTDTYYLGSTTPDKRWKGIYTNDLNVTGTCTGCGGGSSAPLYWLYNSAGNYLYPATTTTSIRVDSIFSTSSTATSTFAKAIRVGTTSDSRYYGPAIVESTNIGTQNTLNSLGLSLINSTSAQSGAQQWSPILGLFGRGYATSLSADQLVGGCIQAEPGQGGLNATGSLIFGTSINTASCVRRVTVTSGSRLGIGATTTPGTDLSIGNTGNSTINISPTSTSTFGSGLDIRTGCFAVNGACVGIAASTPSSSHWLYDTSSDFLYPATTTSSVTSSFFTGTSTSNPSTFASVVTSSTTVVSLGRSLTSSSSVANSNSVNVGYSNRVGGTYQNIAVGVFNDIYCGAGFFGSCGAFGNTNYLSASADYSHIFGFRNSVTGANSFVIGRDNTVTANNSSTIGSQITNSVDGSVMVGNTFAKMTIWGGGANFSIAPASAFPIPASSTLSVKGNGSYGSNYNGIIAPTNGLLVEGTTGIGTTSPYAKLSVTNTGTTPSFIVEDETSPDQSPFIIDASGDVGVGTSTDPARFAVQGISGLTNVMSLASSTGKTLVTVNAAGNLSVLADTSTAASPVGISPINTAYTFFQPTSNRMGLSRFGTEAMRFDSDSLTLNSSYYTKGLTFGTPGSPDAGISRFGAGVIQATNGSTGNGSFRADFFTGTSTTIASIFPNASTTNLTIGGKLYAANSSGTNGMVLQTTGSGINWVATSSLGISGGGSSQWLDSGSDIYFNTGYVGIGTSTPPAKLSVQEDSDSLSGLVVQGPARSSGNASQISVRDGSGYETAALAAWAGGGGLDGYGALVLGNNVPSGTGDRLMEISPRNTANALRLGSIIGALDGATDLGRFDFYTGGGSGSFIHSMTMLNDGKIGMGGNTAPAYALDITGDIHTTGKATFDGGVDPKYIHSEAVTREQTRERVLYEIPVEKWNGPAEFWNVATHQYEFYIASEDKFYKKSDETLIAYTSTTTKAQARRNFERKKNKEDSDRVQSQIQQITAEIQSMPPSQVRDDKINIRKGMLDKVNKLKE